MEAKHQATVVRALNEMMSFDADHVRQTKQRAAGVVQNLANPGWREKLAHEAAALATSATKAEKRFELQQESHRMVLDLCSGSRAVPVGI